MKKSRHSKITPAAALMYHPPSDLNYYMRPENYEGPHPMTMQRILRAKEPSIKTDSVPSLVRTKKKKEYLQKYYHSVLKDIRLEEVADIYDDQYETDTSDESEETEKSPSTNSSKESEIKEFTTKDNVPTVRKKFCIMDVLTPTRTRRPSELRRLHEYIKTGIIPEVAPDKVQAEQKKEGRMKPSAQEVREGRKTDSRTRAGISKQASKGKLQKSIRSAINLPLPGVTTSRIFAPRRRSGGLRERTLPGEIKLQEGSSGSSSSILSDTSSTTCECSLDSGHFDAEGAHALTLAQANITAQKLSPLKRGRETRISISAVKPGSLTSCFNMRIWPKVQGLRPPKMNRRVLLFQHAVRMVIIIRDLGLSMIEKTFRNAARRRTTEDISQLSAVAQGLHHEHVTKDKIFDPSYYRASSEQTITLEVKLILTTPTDKRTREEIQVAMISLQDIKAFAEYPMHMQEKLVTVGWYSFVGPNRIIIRQGHTAENFYFILSGKAVVSLVEEDPVTGDSSTRTCAILRRGMSFGELALLHHAPRTATVRSPGELELLVIGREDFFEIFMAVGRYVGSLPEHLYFLSQIPFMKYWPVGILLDYPESCVCTYFRPGSLVVLNSLESEWIYVVKSGYCQVLKSIHKPKPRLFWKRPDLIEKAKSPYAELGIQEFKPKIDTNLRAIRRACPDPKLGHPSTKSSKTMGTISEITCACKTSEGRSTIKSKTVEFLDSVYSKLDDDTYTGYSMSMSEAKAKVVRKPEVVDDSEKASDLESLRPSISEEIEESIFVKGPPRFLERSSSSVLDSSLQQVESSVIEIMELGHRRNPSTDYAAQHPLGRRSTIPEVMLPHFETDKEHVFLELEVLGPRGVFGLETVKFFDSSEIPDVAVSLVSKGSECILLNKAAFKKFAPAEVQRRVHEMAPVYPDEDELEKKFRVFQEWNLYKTKLQEHTVGKHRPFDACHVP